MSFFRWPTTAVGQVDERGYPVRGLAGPLEPLLNSYNVKQKVFSV